MNSFKQHSLFITQLLIPVVVVLTTWPILKQPRLEADDYRYLHLIQQVEQGRVGAVESMTIENEWSHLWFLHEEGRIRFFRPTVVLSYALDYKLWGDHYARGLTVTNVLIHLLCCWMAGFILHRVIGPGLPAIAASLLFSALAAHAECIWYIAGRTDTLAALGFLGAFALHTAGRRWWALPFFAFGFLTKELVIVAPIVYAAYDVWVDKRRLDGKLFAAYGLLAAVVLIVKQIALGGEGSDFVSPYLIRPFSGEYLTHIWLQFRSYTGNLLAAEETMPFASLEMVSQLHRPIFTVLGAVLVSAACWFLRREKRFWLLMLMGVLVWLPTSFVYLSERYLYLPSLAYAGLLGLLVTALPRRWPIPAGALLLLYALFQANALRDRHTMIAGKPGAVREMIEQIEPVREQVMDAERILLVNLPGHFVRAQFAQDIFRMVFHRPDLQVDVLTMMPGQSGTFWEAGDAWPVMGAGVQVTRTGARELLLSGRILSDGQPPHSIQEHDPITAFNWASLNAGESHITHNLEARIVQGAHAEATAIAFRFSQPLDSGLILVWRADCSDLNEHPWTRRKQASVQAISL